MDDYVELLCYSEKQRALCQQHGHDGGVILLDGLNQPFLWTESVSNMRLKDLEDFSRMRDLSPPGPPGLKSFWNDAIAFYKGNGRGYQRLVDGAGEVTEAGKKWCEKNRVDATPEALRAVAKIPNYDAAAMSTLKSLRSLAMPALRFHQKRKV